MITGIELIAQERQRQIEEEGFDAAHDDAHFEGDLALAGMGYAYQGVALQGRWKNFPTNEVPSDWPWHPEWWKPSDDPIRNLVKAGALIAAEIDRLQRQKES